MLYIASLNSGSNGNSYYIGNEEEAVLIDAGISCRETEMRMRRLGLMMEKVKAIFVSHEHTDHISGIAVLSKKYKLPVYITPATFKNCGIIIEKELAVSFRAHQTIMIGKLEVKAFPKFHDAVDGHSFTVSYNAVTTGIFTDIGKCCENVIDHFKKCHAAFLEANYDAEMLANGNYPYHLKKRISGGEGHLSNAEALELFLKHRPAFMSHLILSHLSKNNNRPELVQQLFDKHKGAMEIIVASRYKETDVYKIGNANHAPVINRKKRVQNQKHLQLSMF
jgi:phosphoribosyl 1,2-cyclic phosphodiesterase